MAFWTHEQDAESQEHVHEYDEYDAVVQGQCVVCIGEHKIPSTRETNL
jgi:hypothetical protein